MICYVSWIGCDHMSSLCVTHSLSYPHTMKKIISRTRANISCLALLETRSNFTLICFMKMNEVCVTSQRPEFDSSLRRFRSIRLGAHHEPKKQNDLSIYET
jgi:hypothetical protein